MAHYNYECCPQLVVPSANRAGVDQFYQANGLYGDYICDPCHSAKYRKHKHRCHKHKHCDHKYKVKHCGHKDKYHKDKHYCGHKEKHHYHKDKHCGHKDKCHYHKEKNCGCEYKCKPRHCHHYWGPVCLDGLYVC